MTELSPSLAAQILVSIILGAAVGGGLALAGVTLFKKTLDRRERRLRREQLRKRAVPRDSEDEIVDDVEHLRPFHEHRALTTESSLSQGA